VEPDWDAPIDVPAHVEAVPGDATMRGFLTTPIVSRARKRGARIGRDRYLPFRAYPLREHVEVLAEGAPILHPGVPLRRALRQVAALTLPALQDTTVGRVLVSLGTGSGGASALGLVARTYGMTRNVGSARVAYRDAEIAILELREIHDFADSLHVGIFEHLLRELGHRGRVDVREHSPFDVDLRLHLDGG